MKGVLSKHEIGKVLVLIGWGRYSSDGMCLELGVHGFTAGLLPTLDRIKSFKSPTFASRTGPGLQEDLDHNASQRAWSGLLTRFC